MKKEIYNKRIALLRQILADKSCDTAWIIQPQNRRYLSGFKADDMHLTESSGSLLINKTQCVLVTDSRYFLEAQREAAGFEIHTLNQGSIEGLPELVKSMGTIKLGFEEDYLTCSLHRQLTERFKALSSPIELVPLNGVVEEMREVKDTVEIKAMEASAVMISAILEEIIAGLKPGLTEKDVAWKIEDMARKAGAESLAFSPIVASGPNSALPHAVPTDRKLRRKEPIILDVGVRLNGYCSDMTRTVFLEKPDSELRKIYMTVRQAQVAALKEVHPGVDSNHPDEIARQIIRDAGFAEYFGHALGHGVGLATHERPRLGPLKPKELKKGMVVTVEPGIYMPDKGGVRLEETVVIEDDGPRILTKNNHFYDFAS
ncbi:MAG: aminopeptidase P family protein [Deltaproteobacteria bacterium]|nr:aminopeptidase P family protein [Deltaproteobacteria bacterium]